MSAIAWWGPPIFATLCAIVYVVWRARPRPPEDTHEAMEARERFRRAIESPTPGADPRSGTNPEGDDGADSAES